MRIGEIPESVPQVATLFGRRVHFLTPGESPNVRYKAMCGRRPWFARTGWVMSDEMFGHTEFVEQGVHCHDCVREAERRGLIRYG